MAARANATDTGPPGQEVVRTVHGTITWIPNAKIIVVANISRQLQAHMTTGFEPWDPNTDMARHYHRGRIPEHIANMLHGQNAAQGFH